jgi:hypothetical protein
MPQPRRAKRGRPHAGAWSHPRCYRLAAAGRAGDREALGALRTLLLGVERPQAQVRKESWPSFKLAQKLGQLQPFIAVFLQECTCQLAYFEPT